MVATLSAAVTAEEDVLGVEPGDSPSLLKRVSQYGSGEELDEEKLDGVGSTAAVAIMGKAPRHPTKSLALRLLCMLKGQGQPQGDDIAMLT